MTTLADLFARGLGVAVMGTFLRPPQTIANHVSEVNNFVDSAVNISNR